VNRSWRIFGLLSATFLLASCSIFGEKDEELEPKELVKIENKLKIKRVWSSKVGGSSDFLLVGLKPAGDGSRIYAASQDGKVVAFNPDTGKQIWKNDLKIELAAGPGVGDGWVTVVSMDGAVVLLDSKSGAEQWRTDVGGESLASPLVKDETIVIQTIDNRLMALSVLDGTKLWELKQTMPALTMRGASSPLIVGPLVIAGFDNGRLLAANIETGDIEWDSMLALPTGRSDLDRLADIDGAIAVVGQDVYAAGYHGRVASIAAESGQVLWSREISSHVGVGADWNSVYTARDDGEVIALGREDGVESWRNNDLIRRAPTLPVPFHTAVVVGDFEGYLHFFSSLDGKAIARVRFGSKAITSDPLVIADRLYVQSDDGKVGAFEVVQDRPKRSAPDISDTADET
jgi:outer membrane protein assembly factor BamB